MSSAAPSLDRPMTVAQFLDWNDGSENRYELIDGRPVAMSPLSTWHMVIVQNIGRALERQLRPPCFAFWSAAGVVLEERGSSWREPDLLVTCKPPRQGFVAAPRLVVEVLSPSTEHADRTTKLDFLRDDPGPGGDPAGLAGPAQGAAAGTRWRRLAGSGHHRRR